jgi:hypothetical protein
MRANKAIDAIQSARVTMDLEGIKLSPKNSGKKNKDV